MQDKNEKNPKPYCRKKNFMLLYINIKEKTKKRTTQIKIKSKESLAFC